LLPAALLGAATGLRSQTGVAALVLLTPQKRLPGPLRGPWPRRLAAFGAVGELVGDKLPFTPSRLSAGPFAGRVIFGAGGGALLAHTRRASLPAGAGAGVLAALAGAKAGYEARTALTARGLPDLPVALAEDALAAGLAVVAAKG